MSSMKTLRQRYTGVTLLLITAALSASAGNELAVVRTSSNSLDIQFAIDEEVTGIQFTVHTSSGIKLQSIKPGPRIKESSWIFDSFNVNDSTLNVLILNGKRNNLANGWGTLASILFTRTNLQEINSVVLTNVMVIDEKGDSLGANISNLEWSDKDPFTTKTDGSKSFIFGQNYPNPFNPSTLLAYRLNTAAHVRLSVFDVLGREVIRLIDQYQYAGDYTVKWDSNSNNGQKLASGLYIARLDVDHSSISRKMLMSK